MLFQTSSLWLWSKLDEFFSSSDSLARKDQLSFYCHPKLLRSSFRLICGFSPPAANSKFDFSPSSCCLMATLAVVAAACRTKDRCWNRTHDLSVSRQPWGEFGNVGRLGRFTLCCLKIYCPHVRYHIFQIDLAYSCHPSKLLLYKKFSVILKVFV